MCKTTTEVCEDCGARKALSFFLSVDGSKTVNRCVTCRAKALARQQGRLREKRILAFGDKWESLVATGEHQACKKCCEVQPITQFKNKTRSGVGTCFGCQKAPTKKPGNKQKYEKARVKRVLERLVESGKNKTDIDYIDCKHCGKKEVKRPRRNYFRENACHQCGINRKNSKRSREEMLAVMYTNIDRENNLRRCTGCEEWKPINDYHSNGKASKCGPCRNEINRNRLKAKPEYRTRESIIRAKLISKEVVKEEERKRLLIPTPIEYIYCKSCGCTEVKKRSSGYRVKDCCLKCCYNIRASVKGFEQYLKMFAPSSTCDQCNKDFTSKLQKRNDKCEPCRGENEARAKRIGSSFRRNAKRSARKDGIRYDPYDVFKRDKWKCKLCNVKVQKRKHLLDNAAEVDHIVPLSMGGRDIPSNVQCLCRKCNNIKGATIAGQVSLFAVAGASG